MLPRHRSAKRPRHPFAPARQCSVCAAEIDVHRAVAQGGVCDRPECRTERMRRDREADRALEATRRALAQAELRARDIDARRASWSLTPANRARLVPLPAEVRREFLAYLRRIVEEATEAPSLTGTPPFHAAEHPTPPDPLRRGLDLPEDPVLVAACTACRGWCCRRGGTHAFLEPDRIRRLMRGSPSMSGAEVIRLYADHLADQHLEDGCVFQGEAGCRLSRGLRGDPCNRWFCEDLEAIRDELPTDGREGVHHFVAISRGDRTVHRIVTATVPPPALPEDLAARGAAPRDGLAGADPAPEA